MRMPDLPSDLTLRQQVEQALQESEFRFRLMADCAPVLIWVSGTDGFCTFFNQTWLHFTGRTLAQEVGSGWTEGVHPDDLQRCLEIYRTASDARHPFQMEYRLRRADGEYRWIEDRGAPRFDVTGEFAGFVGSCQDIHDRKAAELALATSRQHYQNLVENSPDIIERFDLQLRHLYVSPVLTQITGLAPEVFLGKTCRELGMDEVMVNVWEAAVTKVLATGQKQTIEFSTPTLQGVRSFEMAIAPEWSHHDTIESLLCISRDITERHQAEQALRQSEEKFRMAIDFTYNWEYWQAPDGRLVYVSPSCERITSYAPAEFVNNPILMHTIIHPDDRAAFHHHACDRSASTATSEFRIMTRSGKTRWIAHICQPVLSREGKYLGRRATNRDISQRVQLESERQRAEALLRLSEAQLQLALEASGDGLWDWNLVTHEVYYSPRWLEILGYQAEDIPSTFASWVNLMHPEDKPWVIERLQAYLQGSASNCALDYRMRTKAGTWLWVANYGKVVGVDAAGHPLRLIGTQRDIGDRKLKELELQRAMEAAEAASLAKSTFLASMSHELRTPLNVILGFAQVLAREPSLTASQKDDLETIRRSGDHLLNLINDVLDLSKIEAGHDSLELTGFDLRVLLQTLHTMMAERANAKQLSLQIEIAADVPQFVVADEQKLRQILLNLLSNSIKFTQQGHVTLHVSLVTRQAAPTSPSVTPHCPPVDSAHPLQLQFQVSDTGVGIAASEQTKIFDAFVQAEAGKQAMGGTGLGLTISRKLLEVMQGEITVSSTPHRGSTFTVTLPVYPANSATVPHPERDRWVLGLAPNQPQRRILVVDDQPENRRLLQRMLAQIGLDLRTAASGQEALHLWQSWQPDLIWMDIRMPELDGYETTKWIRAFERTRTGEAGQTDVSAPSACCVPPVVIIALTAHACSSDRALALAAGCNDYISKPFREETIYLKLAEHLGLEYVYAEPDANPLSATAIAAHASSEEPSDLPLAAVAALSPAWLAAIADASLCGDDRGIVALAEELPSSCGRVRSRLLDLAHQFQFEQILHWLHPYIEGDSDDSCD
jgi:PAS domain S-box-containing protein